MLNKKLKLGVLFCLGKPKNVFRGFSREEDLSKRIGKAGVSKQAEMALKGRDLRLGIRYVVTPDSRAGADRSPQGVFVSFFLHFLRYGLTYSLVILSIVSILSTSGAEGLCESASAKLRVPLSNFMCIASPCVSYMLSDVAAQHETM